jgi:hypothetical protein
VERFSSLRSEDNDDPRTASYASDATPDTFLPAQRIKLADLSLDLW